MNGKTLLSNLWKTNNEQRQDSAEYHSGSTGLVSYQIVTHASLNIVKLVFN